MKRNLIITREGQICVKATLEEAKDMFGAYTIQKYSPEYNELSEYSLDTMEEIEEAFSDKNDVVAIVGQIPSVYRNVEEFTGHVNEGHARAFAEMCNIEPLVILEAYFDTGRDEVVAMLYNWSVECAAKIRNGEARNMEDTTFYRQFFHEKVNKEIERIAENFVWDKHAIINLQYIMALHPDADLCQNFDNLRLMAVEYTLYERKKFPGGGDAYHEAGTDYETEITRWVENSK